MRNAFNHFVGKYGVVATITVRTPQTSGGEVVKDSKGHTVFTESEQEVKCRIKLGGGRQALFNNAMLQSYDGKGLFKLSDAEYINQDSKLKWEISEENIMYFLIKNIVYKKTHIEADLKSREL